MKTKLELDERELNAVLAALRTFQHGTEHLAIVQSIAIEDIETNFGTTVPLTLEETDALCKRINCGPASGPKGMPCELLREAIVAWPQFDDPDAEVNGADVVQWFGAWRDRAKVAIA